MAELKLALQYRSNEQIIARDFYDRCLPAASSFRRAVGFFATTCFAAAAESYEQFFKQGGYMQLVCCPVLLRSDIELFRAAFLDRRAVLKSSTLKSISFEQQRLATSVKWLMAAGKLELRIAVLSQTPDRIYHEKIGIFDDGHDQVAYTGSANETTPGLYRWGNPITYGAGTASNREYFQQHDVEWIKPGAPGAGDLMCYNNGLGRGTTNASSVNEFIPAVDANGNYSLLPSVVTPTSFNWSYYGNAANPMYSADISGAQRLPNGNTIICTGGTGEFREVTYSGNIVWKYINPVAHDGPIAQGTQPPADPNVTGETLNSVFRIYKYPPDYPAFIGKTLTPGDYIVQ